MADDLEQNRFGASPPEASAAPAGGKRALQVALKVAKWTALVAVVLALCAVLTVFLVIRHHESNLPSVDQLEKGYAPPQVTRVLSRDGGVLANLFTERRTVIPIAEVPAHVKLAFLAAEDATFYEHEGLNYFGMLRALFANLRAGKTVQGGSTITQQVVKNVLLIPERTYERKIKETILARRLEQQLTKDQIFGLYLNHIYLGHGRYGVEEAARYYFGKRCRELDLAEAALLAGMVAAPERFSPRHSPEKAIERRRYVLGQMLEKSFVTQELHDQASKAPLRLAPAADAESELVPEVVSYVYKLLEEVAGEQARRGGYTIATTIDAGLEAAARRAVRENLTRYAERQKLAPPFTADKRKLWGKPFVGSPKAHRIYVGTVAQSDDRAGTIDVRVGDIVGRVALNREERYNPTRLAPSEYAKVGALLRVSLLADPDSSGAPVPLRLELGPQSALVALDVRTREVLAIVGSHEALAGGLDRATKAKRQPGSAFKPFVYSYALHSRRFTPATILDLPGDPRSNTVARRISVRTAIAKSDNAAAQTILEEVGASNVVQWAQALGIESRMDPTPSLALGAYEVTPLELVAAFAAFPSGGEYAPPVIVTKIIGPDGNPLPLPQQPPRRRVLGEDEAYLTTSLLRSVVRDGTGRRATALGRPVAGKTGTTNDAKDAWFVGYSTDLVAGVWVGYDDALPLGAGEAGAATALPAWVDFMKVAHAKRPATEFPRPGNIVVARVDPASGLLAFEGQAEAIDEEFLDGTAPSQTATPDAGADAGANRAVESESQAADAGARPEEAVKKVQPAVALDFGADGGPIPEPPPF